MTAAIEKELDLIRAEIEMIESRLTVDDSEEFDDLTVLFEAS